jgi:hypothetical protein
MSNSQWNEDQAAGEKAQREWEADRVRVKAERLQLAQVLKELFANMDCGDRSCRFKSQGYGGMRTNGGCRCLGELRKSERDALVEMVERIAKDG